MLSIKDFIRVRIKSLKIHINARKSSEFSILSFGSYSRADVGVSVSICYYAN